MSDVEPTNEDDTPTEPPVFDEPDPLADEVPRELFGSLDAEHWASLWALRHYDELDVDKMVRWFGAALAVGRAAGRGEARDARARLRERLLEELGRP